MGDRAARAQRRALDATVNGRTVFKDLAKILAATLVFFLTIEALLRTV
jgi:hypothetical protein